MAKYEHLPIYKGALELVVFLENAVRGFSRYHKYSIGERLRQASWDVVTLVVKANNTPVAERLYLLIALRDKVQELSIALAVAKELEAFSKHKSWQQAARMAVNLSRQSEGWLKSTHQPSPPES